MKTTPQATRPWKAGIDGHLARTSTGRFREWNKRLPIRAIFPE